MLEIKNLHVNVDGREILNGLDLTLPQGEVHAIMGPNGSGKSTLAYVLAGKEDYHVTAGSITWNGEDLLAMAPSELQRFMRGVQEALEAHAMRGELPALVTTPAIRPFVRSVIERFRPATVVLSQNELHPKARVRTLGQI